MKKYIKDIPKLASEYDFDKNIDIEFDKLTHSSAKEVWWKCKENHEWRSRVYYRTKGGIVSCPLCSNQRAHKDYCLKTSHSELIKEWNYSKNSLKPNEVTYGSTKKVWWKCSRGHEWKVAISDRTKSQTGCPTCGGKFEKSLFLTHGNLKELWDKNKNTISHNDVTAGSHKKIWWTCQYCSKSYLSPVKRVVAGHRCPYCSSKEVSKEKSFSTICPHLLKEWNYSKNTIKPEEVTYGSKKKVWWKCNKNHEWKVSILNRHSGSNCPICNESKGEKLVSQVLDKLQVRYKREYRFPQLNKYRFDFALFKKYKRKPWATIEYHGQQHYTPVKFSPNTSLAKAKECLASCQKRDKIKKQYCLNNNISYLEISYKEKDNIKEKIKDFLK